MFKDTLDQDAPTCSSTEGDKPLTCGSYRMWTSCSQHTSDETEQHCSKAHVCVNVAMETFIHNILIKIFNL